MCRIFRIRLFLLIIYLIRIKNKIYQKVILLKFKISLRIIKTIIILEYLRIIISKNKKYFTIVDKETNQKHIKKWMK